MAGATRRQWLAGTGITWLAALTACSSPPPPPPPPTIVKLTLATGSDANPTSAGQGAPVVIRVYQLASTAAFDKAEFLRIYNQDTATLGADIVKKDEYLLPPGSTKDVTLQPVPTVKAIGVFAAYRDFTHVTWRASTDVPEHVTTDVAVTATAQGIALQAKPEPPPAKPAS